MAKYLIIYSSSESAKDMMDNASSEEMQDGMKVWLDWQAEAEKTVKIDFGLPMLPVGRITSEGRTTLDSQMSGHSFIEANSVDQVFEVLANHPQLQRPGGSIDVYELLAMPGIE